MDDSSLKYIGAGIAMIGTHGAGLGLGKIFSAWLSGIARNPAAEGKLSKVGFVGFAVTELVLLMGFVIAIMILKS